MDIKMDAKKANLLLLMSAFTWGSGFVGSQYALDAALTPFQLICGRMFIGSICLCVFFRKKLSTISVDEIKVGSVIGLFLFLGFTFQTYGLQYTTPSVNAFVTAVYVVLTPFIRWFIIKEKPDMYANIGAVLTVIGIGFISLTDGFNLSIGIPLTLVCSVAYAFQVVFTDKYTKEYDPINLTVIIIVFNFLLAFAASAFFAVTRNDLPGFSRKGAISILYLGVVCTFIAYIGQNVGQKYTTAVKAAIIMSLEAVFGMALSALIYKEVLTGQMVFGCIIVFCAIIISETKLEFLNLGTNKNRQ